MQSHACAGKGKEVEPAGAIVSDVCSDLPVFYILESE